MNLATGKSSRSCTYILFLPQEAEIGLFLHYRQRFRNMDWFSKLPYLGMKLGRWQKFQKLHVHSLSTLGSKMSLFLLYGQRFLRYRPIFNIFGHDTWPLAKVPEVIHTLSFYHRGRKWPCFFVLRAAIYEIGADFQNCHIWTWNLAVGQSFRSCT